MEKRERRCDHSTGEEIEGMAHGLIKEKREEGLEELELE
jgi:hypothetical protein